MYSIDYNAKNLTIAKYEDEMLVPTIGINMRRARINVEDDLEIMEGDILLRVHNAMTGRTDDALPPDPAHAVWGLLEAAASFPIEVSDTVPTADAPPIEKVAKRSKKKLQTTNASTTSVQPDNSSDDGGKNMTTSKDGKDKGKAAAKKAATPKKAAAKKAATPKKAAGAKTGPRGEKILKVKALLERKNGCTRIDILSATGWPAVSVPAMAKACGLKLRKESVEGTKDVRAHTRYYGEA